MRARFLLVYDKLEQILLLMNALHAFISSPKQILKNFRLIILLPAFLMMSNCLLGQFIPLPSQYDICSAGPYNSPYNSPGCWEHDNYKLLYEGNINTYTIPIISKNGNKIKIQDANFEDIEDDLFFCCEYEDYLCDYYDTYGAIPAPYFIDIYVCDYDEPIYLGTLETDPSNNTHYSLDPFLSNPILDTISCIDKVYLTFVRQEPFFTYYYDPANDADYTLPYVITSIDPITANDTCVIGGSIQFDTQNSYVDLNGVI